MLSMLLTMAEVHSQETSELTLTNEDTLCWLMERGTIDKNKLQRQTRTKDNVCRIVINKNEFDSRFHFCYFAGFHILDQNNPTHTACSLTTEARGSKLFESIISSGNSLICMFTCVVR